MDVVRGAYLFSRSASSIQRGALQLFGLSNFSWVDDVFFKGGAMFFWCAKRKSGLVVTRAKALQSNRGDTFTR